MKLKRIVIENYKGINTPITIDVNDFVCIVGKNDVGKSTILKAIDAFINDNNPVFEDKNIYNDSNTVSIGLQFDCERMSAIIDDSIPITFEDEELVDDSGLLCITKKWDVSQKTIKPQWYIRRKKYLDGDFVMLVERELKNLCRQNGIDIAEGQGNSDMRNNLREHHRINDVSFEYSEDMLPTTGQTRPKKILDAIKEHLPNFGYFRADKSLSDSDAAVQKYFKEKALSLLKEQVSTDNIESSIKKEIGESLSKITDKINSVLSENDQISAQVDFDWSKLITTSFKCKKEESNIPLSARGDGFRRITMMSYFEMLAEEKKEGKDIIFGFEEPETFLHPGTQRLLYQKLYDLTQNGYQVLITTHSPNIVSETNVEDIVFVTKIDDYCISQGSGVDVKVIVEELGIKADNTLLSLFDSVRGLLLVEGPDDVMAMSHLAAVYKQNRKIERTFDEHGILIIPVGGCGSIKHWTNYSIITKLGKPFFIFLDSDKKSETDDSKTLKSLKKYGYSMNDCAVSKKREIECYIPCSYFQTLIPPISISYGDWDDVKELCNRHQNRDQLGRIHVCEKHFRNLSYDQLRSTFCPDGNDANDEFLSIYNKLVAKI